MKSKMLRFFVILTFVWGIASISPSNLNAASDNTIRIYNMAGQAAFTLLRGIIQGKVKSFKDVAKSLFYGSAAGYGFYEAKKMIGKGHVTTGVILANLSASVCENVSTGLHPLAYIGYNIGPVQLKVATPFAKKPQATFHVSVTPAELITFFYSMKNAKRVSFRGGLITFTANERTSEKSLGWTIGQYPTILRDTPDYVFNHEAIHVVQHLQMMSISPEIFMSYESEESNYKKSLFHFSGLRMNVVGSLTNMLFYRLQSYKSNWLEIEAYNFATNETSE